MTGERILMETAIGIRAEQARLVRALDVGNSVKDVAGIFGVSDRSIWRWIKDGEIKAERLSPRCVRIFDSEISRFRERTRA